MTVKSGYMDLFPSKRDYERMTYDRNDHIDHSFMVEESTYHDNLLPTSSTLGIP